jgi:glutaconyl-CoA/methylmalonyl-CoA decarboxylase subunit gamma
MTLYRVMVGKREYSVEVSGSQLSVNGEHFPAKLTPVNELGLFQLWRGEIKRELHLHRRGNTFSVLAMGRYLLAQVEKATGKDHQNAQESAGDVRAPMPGIVVRTSVESGQMVEQGQVVVVVESMKMQMEFRAPVAGRVESVAVKPSDQVNKGVLMVRIVEE